MTGQLESSPNEPVDHVVRGILLHLATTIEENWQGIIEDHDPEPLHDLRVANRRTRTVLGELKGTLPKKTVAPFRRDFKWLASITGPCRDYDVWLNDLSSDLRQVAPPQFVGSEVVLSAIRERRQYAWFELKEQLLSYRFQALVPAWKTVLNEKTLKATKNGMRRAGDFASERIKRAHSRLVGRQPEIVQGAPEEILHRIRIDAKKLRYLLEFFSGFYRTTDIHTVTRALKNLQDDLGCINDCAVQLQLLDDLRLQFEGAGNSPTTSMMGVIVDLQEHIRARQMRCWAPFVKHYSDFSGGIANQTLADLINNPCSKTTDDPATP